MNLGIFINDVATEKAEYATTSIARAAVAHGHRVWYIGVDDFAYDPDENACARARTPARKKHRTNEAFVEDLLDDDTPVERITVADLDVLLLRNNPADDFKERPWAQYVGIVFGQIAARKGVLVLNDPNVLANALNKLYFQFFPEEVRPATLITRDREEIRAFHGAYGRIVLKPLQGSGGDGVFLVEPDETANLNQIIDAIRRDGYVVAQEYLPAAAEGDLRVFLMNGEPLMVDGKYAAMRRTCSEGDVRSNIHAGGKADRAEVTDKVLEITESVRPKLMQDGLFLVGLDIAGDRLLEVNVFSPGGLWSMERFEQVDFSARIVEALEHKVRVMRRYPGDFSNVQLATL